MAQDPGAAVATVGAPVRAGAVPPAASLDEVCAANLLDASGEVTFFFKDLDGRFVRVSRGCAELTGRTPEQMIGLTDVDLTDAAHAAELRRDEQRIIATGEPMIDKREVDRLANVQGTLVETSKFPLRAPDGTIVGTFGYSRDVTRWALAERKVADLAQASAAAHARLMLVEAQLRDVLNSSSDAIAMYDTALRYRYLNPAATALHGAPMDELIGRTDREIGMTEDELAVWEPVLRRVLAEGEPAELTFSVLVAGSGARGWFHATVSANRDAAGDVVGVLTSARDISEIRRAEQSLVHQANHDPLTGLANRHLLMDRLHVALADLERTPQRLTLLFVDLDHFKDVNDQYGHEVGDQVLVEVARRLVLACRQADTVARLGGDEFVVLCDHGGGNARGDEVAVRIARALIEPIDAGAVTLRLTASVGVAWTEDPATGASGLLRAADSAMYAAKERGRDRYALVEATSTLPH
ncbi:sensor domain-containing protein [Pengzhenrongella sicca]|uniref:Diguanylate cyclase n=1 Tax=Pengzhenrongella sicca TaxID=2819238 RepID=A0A8A4ZC48_9MICO|nr:diguanylate cyclase [Pengzhenrongella sicca]QTE29570.1 diguanylate cyclase [Pengzhenrongella sicca]